MTDERMAELVKAVKVHALAHYNDGGWDVVVECFGDDEIAEEITTAGATTPQEAIDVFGNGAVPVWADRQADARNSAF